MTTVTLSRPIQAHGEERRQIELREPNGGDIAACGFPFRFSIAEDGSQTILPEASIITALISRLGNVPRSSVAQLSFSDWMSCMGEVFSFFGASVPTSSTAVSISPGSGDGTLTSH
jgi:hypothetical protein